MSTRKLDTGYSSSASEMADAMERAWKNRGPEDTFVSVQCGDLGMLIGTYRELECRGYTVCTEKILNGIIAIVGEA